MTIVIDGIELLTTAELASDIERELDRNGNVVTPTAAQLVEKYGTDGECPDFTKADWRLEVHMEETCLGYWERAEQYLYNSADERVFEVDHDAERLLVERAAVALEILLDADLTDIGFWTKRSDWEVLGFEEHDEIRTDLTILGNPIKPTWTFFVEFEKGTALPSESNARFFPCF